MTPCATPCEIPPAFNGDPGGVVLGPACALSAYGYPGDLTDPGIEGGADGESFCLRRSKVGGGKVLPLTHMSRILRILSYNVSVVGLYCHSYRSAQLTLPSAHGAPDASSIIPPTQLSATPSILVTSPVIPLPSLAFPFSFSLFAPERAARAIASKTYKLDIRPCPAGGRALLAR